MFVKQLLKTLVESMALFHKKTVFPSTSIEENKQFSHRGHVKTTKINGEGVSEKSKTFNSSMHYLVEASS